MTQSSQKGPKDWLSRSRELRRNSSDAENTLWKQLRGCRLKGYKFRRQVVIEPYIVDFVCLEAQLIIEADGGQHIEQKVYDAERTAMLETRGYRVMRFWNHDILNQTQIVLGQIVAELPLPPGED